MRKLNNILVTGGAGFIGSNFINYLFANPEFSGVVVNLDKLTYAGNLENLKEIDKRWGGIRYFFERIDICDYKKIKNALQEYGIDTIVHFAAESHVDRSILGPRDFIDTNIVGTFNLLEAARNCWKERDDVLFHHVSSDEVYGSLGKEGCFTEKTPYDPKSPYSASKAAADHLVRAVNHTYGLPATVSNCSNNYGSFQFPEKLIPLMILNMLEAKTLPIYGDGRNIRDWLYVQEHAEAIWLILKKGVSGETYNIGGNNEWANIDLVDLLCERVALLNDKSPASYKRLITFVKDRPGHDRRYAIDCSKIKKDLGWKSRLEFTEGLDITIKWYMHNTEWVERVRSGKYKNWIKINYRNR